MDSPIILPVVVPLAAAPLLTVRPIRPYLMAGVMILLAAGSFRLLTGPDPPPLALLPSLEEIGLAPLVFSLHPYGKITSFALLLVGSAALLFGYKTMRVSEQCAALGALAAAVGVTFSGNFLTFYIFWEMLTLCTAGLILLHRTPQALQMGLRFFFIQLAGGLCLFMGILMHYSASGSFDLAAPVAGLPLFIAGIGVKTAFIPLHLWLPWGYPAASYSCSVLLSALSTKVGVFAVARILPPHQYLVLMGATMAVFGVIMAVRQKELRLLLSYHIVSQVGYMVAGVGLGLPLAVDGGMLHLVNHMIYKALLFMSAGALIYTAGTEKLSRLQGGVAAAGAQPAWRALPVAFLGALVGALAIAGTPPFSGYVSKYLLKTAHSGSGVTEWMLLLAGAGTALSFAKFIYFGFIRSQVTAKNKLPASMQAAILILSAATLLLGLHPGLAAPLLPHGSALAVYPASGVTAALAVMAAGTALFAALKPLLDPSRKSKRGGPAFPRATSFLAGVRHGLRAGVHFLEDISQAQVQLVFTLILTLSLTYIFFYMRIF